MGGLALKDGSILVVAAVWMFLTVILVAIGLGMDKWQEISTSAATFEVGVWDQCVKPAGGTCTALDLPAVVSTMCNRKNSDLDTRVKSLKGLFLGGGGVALLSGLLHIIANCKPPKALCPVATLLAFTILGFCAIGGGLILFLNTFDDWMFCSRSYCTMIREQGSTLSCTDELKISFFLVCAGACTYGLGVLFSILSVWKAFAFGDDAATTQWPPVEMTPAFPARSSPDAEDVPQEQRTAAPATVPPTAQPAATTAEPAESKGPGLEGTADGDWVFDPAKNMYYSASNNLFLCPDIQHYFDPDSGMWYNPTTAVWYNRDTGEEAET